MSRRTNLIQIAFEVPKDMTANAAQALILDWLEQNKPPLEVVSKKKPRYFRSLVEDYGLTEGSVYKVIEEDGSGLYYYDDWHRWCVLEKSTEGVDFQYVDRNER